MNNNFKSSEINNFHLFRININISQLLFLFVFIITKLSISLCSVVPFNQNQNPLIKKLELNYRNQEKLTISPYGYTLSRDLGINSSNKILEILPDTNELGFYIRANIGNPVYGTTIFLDFLNYYSYIFTNQMKNPSFNFCHNEFNFFEPSESSTYTIDKNKNFPSKIFVRDFNLTGQSALDTIIFSLDNGADIQMEDFSFNAIERAEMKYDSSLCFGGSRYFGGIGFGFTNLKGFSFLEQMKNKNLIEEKIFSILLPLQAEKSILHLGGYKKEFVNDTNDINWVNVNFPQSENNEKLKSLFDKKYNFNNELNSDANNTARINWFIESPKIYMNNVLYPQFAKIFVDSLSPHITIPKTFFFENFKNFFSNETDCKMETDGYFYCKCHPDINKDYPSFYFEFNQNFNLTMLPRDYLEIVIDYNTEDVRACRLLMKLNYENNYWGFGKYIMNNYYMIFNQETNKLGFYDRNKINQIDSDLALIMIMIVSCTSFIILAILYCCIRKIIERRNPNSNNQALLGI